MAIDRYTAIVAGPASGPRSRVWAIDLDRVHEADFSEPLSPVDSDHPDAFANYVLGVVDQFKARGHDIPPLDIVITSAVPRGKGLSSSASIEVAMAIMLARITGADLNHSISRFLSAAEHAFPARSMRHQGMLVSHRRPARLAD